MSELNKFRMINKLKSIYRLSSVGDRHESTAEHTWSSLILADWVLEESHLEIDRLRVYELLMYHDLVEIYAGDTPILSEYRVLDQKQRENAAFKRLIKELPKSMVEKYSSLYDEFETRTTIEAKFARAIEELDSSIHEMDYKKDWKGFTEKFLREKKMKYYEDFPLIIELFEEFLRFANKNGFFDQK